MMSRFHKDRQGSNRPSHEYNATKHTRVDGGLGEGAESEKWPHSEG